MNEIDFDLDFFKNKYNLKISDNLVHRHYFVNSIGKNFTVNFFQENLNSIDINILKREILKLKRENDFLNKFDNKNFNTSNDKFLLTKKIEDLENQKKKSENLLNHSREENKKKNNILEKNMLIVFHKQIK